MKTPDNLVCILKPNYKSNDGTIKKGIEINGKWYAPKTDLENTYYKTE